MKEMVNTTPNKNTNAPIAKRPAKKRARADRRKSKGRKLRYDVMPKMVHYMTPATSSDYINWQKPFDIKKSLFR